MRPMHAPSIISARLLAGFLAGSLVACGSSEGPPKKLDEAAKADAPEKEKPKRLTLKKDQPVALPPGPEGTVAIGHVYVQTCDKAEACPELLQAPGAAHCAGLELGGMTWRLPKIEELLKWKGNEALHGFDVFHWSGSAWEDDAAQWWIYDPDSEMKTTAKPDRKPFTIRCVAAPT